MKQLITTSWFFALAVLGVLAVSVDAQITSSGEPSLSIDERKAALRSIKEKFHKLYVIPELRPAIVERLDVSQRSGRYNVTDPRVFAERITEDLKAVTNDKHLSLSYDQRAYRAAQEPPKSNAGDEAFRRRRAMRNNHGIAGMQILPGNTRYLKITRFEWISDETGAVYDDAMRFLKGGDAWIVDLRGNPGGTSSAAHYFSSHFHDPAVESYTSYAGSETPEKTRAVDHLPAGRLKGKPLYMLIDGNTGSAAEAVAYDLQQFKLAQLVGTKTAGAAYNVRFEPIAPSFILGVSYGRPLHAITKGNWEGVGVQPNIATDPTKALDTALLLALGRLSQMPGVSPELLTEYRWARTAVEARLTPVSLASFQMAAWSGEFRSADYGEVKVSLADNSLWLERPGRPRARLTPLTAQGLFAIEGNDLLRTRIGDQTLELLWWDDPNPRIYTRFSSSSVGTKPSQM